MEVEKYYKIVQSIVNKYPKELRADLFNDGVIVAMGAIERWTEGSGKIEAYIYTTVKYRLRDEVKKYRSANLISELSTDRLLELDVSSKDELYKFLESIPAEHRIILEKHYSEGYSTTEIAELYSGITGIATRESVSRILKKYKKQ